MPAPICPPIVDYATRRQFLTLLGAAGLLNGCAADQSAEPSPAARTRSIDAGFSPVEVPAQPARVFVADFQDAEAALALGVTPTAARPAA